MGDAQVGGVPCDGAGADAGAMADLGLGAAGGVDG